MSLPLVQLGALPEADGSASYSWQGFDVLGSVNGPIEPQRRDELPEEAFLEIHVRPVNGVGGTRERRVERLLHSTLRSIILTNLHPRSLIQLTLQLLSTPETSSTASSVPQHASHLPSLPHLLQTALLTLLNANIPLSTTFTTAFVGTQGGRISAWPAQKLLQHLDSTHVFAFSAKGETLLIESEGEFDMEEFDTVARHAQAITIGLGDSAMDTDEAVPLQIWLRQLLEEEIKTATRWRQQP